MSFFHQLFLQVCLLWWETSSVSCIECSIIWESWNSSKIIRNNGKHRREEIFLDGCRLQNCLWVWADWQPYSKWTMYRSILLSLMVGPCCWFESRVLGRSSRMVQVCLSLILIWMKPVVQVFYPIERIFWSIQRSFQFH